MLDIDKDVIIGLTLLKKGCILPEDFRKGYRNVFLKTNEDLGSYYMYFPISDGIVSTIIGSGDHILQAIKDNPKKIYAFDINPFTIYIAKLKVASCLALELEKYNEYYEYNGKKSFNMDYYKKIREYLDYDAKKFWDRLYIDGDFSKRYKMFFIATLGNTNIGLNSFEKSENYIKTRKNIMNTIIEYFPLEFYEMFKLNIDNIKYDAIFLSNIFNWVKSTKEEIEFFKFIKEKLSNKLSDKGMIAVYCPPKYFSSNKIIMTDNICNIDKKNIVVFKKKL